MKIIKAAVSLLLATAYAGTAAAGTNPDSVRQEIQATVTQLENAIEKGVSAEELTRMMYVSDAIVTGEGVAKARHGIAAETVAIDAFLHSLAKPGQRHCRFVFLEPITMSSEVTAAFVNLTCRPASADEPSHAADLMDYHVLYVWRKSANKWKVSLEMFAGNKM